MLFSNRLKNKLHVLASTSLCLVALSACSSAPESAPESAAEQAGTQNRSIQSGGRALVSKLFGVRAFDALAQVIAGPQDVVLTPEEARGLPYAASYVQIEGQARALLVLGEADALGLSAPRLQWFSNTGEVLETLDGRVVGIHGLTFDRSGVVAERPDTLACFRQGAVTDQGIEECVRKSENSPWSFDMRIQTPYHSVYHPHTQFERIAAPLSYRVVDRSYELLMPNGNILTTLRIEETGVAGSQQEFTNEFYIDRNSGRVVMSKQWLGDALEYITIQDVQPYAAAGGQAPNSPFRYVDHQANAHPNYPDDLLTVKVRTTDNKVLQAHFAGEPRMSQVISTLPADGSGWFYGPLTRVHSAKLDQEFAARKEKMRLRLLMLARTYRAEGKPLLAAAATELLNEFDRWPLRGTYIHGFNLAEARINLAENHKLNFPDARTDASSAAWYEIQLNDSPPGAKEVGLPGHEQSDKSQAYVVDIKGKITRVPMAEHNSNAEIKAIAEQPGALVLYSLAEEKLPKGFRDLNDQLTLFLQQWDFSQ